MKKKTRLEIKLFDKALDLRAQKAAVAVAHLQKWDNRLSFGIMFQ